MCLRLQIYSKDTVNVRSTEQPLQDYQNHTLFRSVSTLDPN